MQQQQQMQRPRWGGGGGGNVVASERSTLGCAGVSAWGPRLQCMAPSATSSRRHCERRRAPSPAMPCGRCPGWPCHVKLARKQGREGVRVLCAWRVHVCMHACAPVGPVEGAEEADLELAALHLLGLAHGLGHLARPAPTPRRRGHSRPRPKGGGRTGSAPTKRVVVRSPPGTTFT